MRMPAWMVVVALLSLLGAPACQEYIDDIDDDDDTGDDDTGDDDAGDDDAGDDDAGDDDAGDDDAGDDDSGECGEDVEQALAGLAAWEALISCGNVYLGIAEDSTQQIAIAVHLDAEELAYSVGMTETFGLAGSGGTLRLETGENLLHYDCNDAIWLEEIIDRRWDAVAGSAVLEIVAVGEWGEATAMISLVDVVIEDPDEPSSHCPVPDVTWGPMSIGWLPG